MQAGVNSVRRNGASEAMLGRRIHTVLTGRLLLNSSTEYWRINDA